MCNPVCDNAMEPVFGKALDWGSEGKVSQVEKGFMNSILILTRVLN